MSILELVVLRQKKNAKYICLSMWYMNMFSWFYGDLKSYDTCIIQYVISFKEDVKLCHQKLRKVHPTLQPLIYKELKKILNSKIILKVRQL